MSVADKLERTSLPGVFRAHRKGCDRAGKCKCPYTVVSRHRGKQHKKTVHSWQEAKDLKGERLKGNTKPTARMLVGDWYRRWIKRYRGRTSRGLTESSREEYQRSIEKWILPAWEREQMGEVEAPDVADLFDDMRDKGASTSEIKKTRAAGSAMFASAVEDKELRLPGNPFLGVRIPPGPNDEDPEEDRAKAMTREELGLMLAAIPEEWRLFFELLVHTGCRIGEAIALNWEHLELDRAQPRIRIVEQVHRGKRKKLKSKEGKRNLPLSAGMVAKLLAHRAATYQGEKAPVFCSPGRLRRTPEGYPFPLSPQNFAREVLHPARKALGMEWVTFHSFRHTTASLLFDEGKNLVQVQKWLGHSDARFTLTTYVHLMDEGVGEAAFLDDAVAPAGGNSRATQAPQISATQLTDSGAPSPL